MTDEVIYTRTVEDFLDILKYKCDIFFSKYHLYTDHPSWTNLTINIFVDYSVILHLKFDWRSSTRDEEIRAEFVTYRFNNYEIELKSKEIHPMFVKGMASTLAQLGELIDNLFESILDGNVVVLTETILY
jgi:hypothetical protein